MINWWLYPVDFMSTPLNHFSPRLKEILSSPENWGLKGDFRYYTSHYEINRFDSLNQTPYTQWTTEQQGKVFIRIWWSPDPQNPSKNKYQEAQLDYWDIEIDPEGDDVATRLMEFLKNSSLEDGYELVNATERDLNITLEDEFREPYTVVGGGTGEFEPTGDGENYGLEWTANVDFSKWRQVKL